MKKIVGMITLSLMCFLFSPWAMAADPKIAVVNVTDIYNKSTFVQKANKALQDHAKSMEAKLQAEKTKLQAMASDFEKTPAGNKRNALAKQINEKQASITQMTQQYQQKIQEEQSSGLQKFTQLVQTAVEKVAKEKGINTVLNRTSVVYTDNTWIDITGEVQAAMQQK